MDGNPIGQPFAGQLVSPMEVVTPDQLRDAAKEMGEIRANIRRHSTDASISDETRQARIAAERVKLDKAWQALNGGERGSVNSQTLPSWPTR